MDTGEDEEQVLIHLKEYKCSCCLDFMTEPFLSSCGHKFCESCIKSWLKQNSTCPMCKGCLNEDYIFPDNYTKRKIAELRIKCPNAEWGCFAKLPPHEIEDHSKECLFEPMKDGQFTCPFNLIGCTESIDDKETLQKHLQQFSNVHFYLLIKDHSELKKKYEELQCQLKEKISEYEDKFSKIDEKHELQEQENEELRKLIGELESKAENDFKAVKDKQTKEDEKIKEILQKQEQFKLAMASL